MKQVQHGTRIAANLKLAPPGAGLPLHERISGRLALALGARLRSTERVTEDFLAEGRRVLDLARSVPETDARRRVLVRRIPMMEDSSRYWSLYMVLDHLIQVDTAVWVLLRRLAGARAAGMQVKIEAVKPHENAGPDRIAAFESLLGRYAETLHRVGDLRRHRSARHPHPWFGRLDAARWHLLAARHHRIHRIQAERILAGLRLPD